MDFSDIRLNITGINPENFQEKFETAVKKIGEAMGITPLMKAKADPKKESEWNQMPLAIRELEEKFFFKQKEVVSKLIDGLEDWLHSKLEKATSHFKIKGKTIYSSKGKPMTVSQWQEIEYQITKYLRENFVKNGEKLADTTAVLQGLLLQVENQGKEFKNIPLERFDVTADLTEYIKKKKYKQKNFHGVYNAFNGMVSFVTDASERLKSNISKKVLEGIRDGKSAGEVEKELRPMDKAGAEWNKDWRRIAQTEMATVRSDMHLAEVIAIGKGSAYMIGVGGDDACETCKRDVIGKVVKLLAERPSTDDEIIEDDHTDTAIWVGKRSIGFGPQDARSAVPRHPHCACRWKTHFPQFDKQV